MACNTLYQCFKFLARQEGVVSFARNPENPDEARCVIRAGLGDEEQMAVLSFPITSEIDIFTKAFAPTCKALQDILEE